MTKPELAECLLEAGRVMARSLPDSPVAIAYLNDLARYRNWHRTRKPFPPNEILSPRQQAAVGFAERGMTNGEIAKKMGVTIHCVKKTLNDARRKK